jgi:hypothetical protein
MGATCCKPDPSQTKSKKGKPSIKKDATGIMNSQPNLEQMGEGLEDTYR